MNPLHTLLVFSALTLSACSGSRNTTRTTTQTQTQKGKSTTQQVSAVKMSRGACFGRCPVYDLEVYNSGLIRYTGRRFVKQEGVYEKMFDKAQVSNFLQRLSQARPDTMQNSYAVTISDLPSVHYVVYYADGKAKNIDNAHFGPDVLKKMAEEMDTLVKSDKIDFSWKKIAAKAE